jgi:hypothetical protein
MGLAGGVKRCREEVVQEDIVRVVDKCTPSCNIQRYARSMFAAMSKVNSGHVTAQDSKSCTCTILPRGH